MHSLHGNQKRILEYLLENTDGATIDELAEHLGITKSAAKEHLLKVESFGYLDFVDVKGPVGRPKRKYLLSKEGQEVFPKQYSWLSNSLLKILANDLGKSGVTKLMHSLADQVSESMAPRFAAARSSAERLNLISQAMNELGYRSRLKQSDVRKGAILEATNCVYHTVAKEHPELCKFDIRFLENASGLEVKMESCIARGGSVCRFCMRKRV